MFLETERLVLRKFREEDFGDFFEYAADREMSRMMGRHYRRRGLMYEALRAVIDKLFQTEGVDYIHCGYFDFNVPSSALQKKLGFTQLTTGTISRNGEEIRTVENVLWRA